jgi:hypothetical protein
MVLRVARQLGLTIGLFGPLGLQAHHSYTEFDATQTVEIEGTLLAVAWQNPHTRMEVRVLDASNRAAVWDIETAAVNALRRRGAPLDAFQTGEVVKIAGWPSKRTAARMYGTNLLGRGHELMAQTGTQRWPGSAIYRQFESPTSRLPAAVDTPTLFRVWGIDLLDPETLPGLTSRAQLSLTETAQKAVASFDPVTQSVTSGCTPKGMPLMMGQPFPMEFVDRADAIVLRLEEYDAVRTIHMNGAAPPASQPSSLFGYSVGRWEGSDTLVVETDRLDSPWFNSRGVPLGKSAHIVERFTVSGDGRRLSYTLTVTDPETFTEPARATRAWVANEGEQQLSFDCKAPRY